MTDSTERSGSAGLPASDEPPNSTELSGSGSTAFSGSGSTPLSGSGATALPAQAPASLAELATEAQREVAVLDRELTEIDMLVQQARSEASRHETRRKQVEEKLAALEAAPDRNLAEIVELSSQLLTHTKRAAIMDTQVEVLAGKQKVLSRYRDSLARYATGLTATVEAREGAFEAQLAELHGTPGEGGEAGEGVRAGLQATGLQASGLASAHVPPALSRVILGAQEDLRRQIARSLHDGPAQSLTNIVLQAEIVERLMARDPEMALGEVRQLVSMVQATLEATKSFIFEVRPMVLDDLGLVPTLRRAARDRGRHAHIPVDFDSLGADRRLPMDLESGLFRIVDEALGAYLGLRPDRVSIRLDWSEHLEVLVSGFRQFEALPSAAEVAAEGAQKGVRGRGKNGQRELPPALAAMIEDRRATQAARAAAALVLPASVWREIQQRAETIGVSVELRAEGSELAVVAELPPEGD